ncbi:MAG: SH3 domain-containing protein, partial [Chloroflexota bacterium]
TTETNEEGTPISSTVSTNLSQWNTIPFQGSIFDEIDGSPDLGVTANVLASRNLHRRPSRRAGIIGVVPPNSQVSVIGRTREITYDDWYHVRIGGVVGWIEAGANAEAPPVEVNAEAVRALVPVR